MNVIKINRYERESARFVLKSSKILNKELENKEEIIKIANAKDKPDTSLPEQETQYIIED